MDGFEEKFLTDALAKMSQNIFEYSFVMDLLVELVSVQDIHIMDGSVKEDENIKVNYSSCLKSLPKF